MENVAGLATGPFMKNRLLSAHAARRKGGDCFAALGFSAAWVRRFEGA